MVCLNCVNNLKPIELSDSVQTKVSGPDLHVVWNEAFIMPMTVLTMFIFLRTNSKIALWGYLTIAVVGFIGLGLYEGGWNHSLKILGYLRIGSPEVDITNILPLNNIDL